MKTKNKFYIRTLTVAAIIFVYCIHYTVYLDIRSIANGKRKKEKHFVEKNANHSD